MDVLSLSDLFVLNRRFLWFSNIFDVEVQQSLGSEELIIRIQKWEKKLFEDLVERFSDKIFRYLFYYFGFDKKIAEDIVQDIFVKLWENLDKYNPEKKFEPWLYRFVHNFTIDWIRKNKKDQNVRAFSQMIKNNEDSCNNFEELFVVDSSDLKKDVHKKIKGQIIQMLVCQLDEKYRELVILFYFEQKSYEEIAYILSTNVNNVGTMLSRAKQKIKMIIESQSELKDVVVMDLD